MSHNTWPGGFRHAMTQAEHRQWNAHNWPGTRQICCRCKQVTGRCEEDEITLESGEGPLCVECWHQTDEYKRETQE